MCMVFAEAHPARNLGELSYKALKQKKYNKKKEG